MRVASIFLTSLAIGLSVFTKSPSLPHKDIVTGINRTTAIEYCDKSPLDNLEGIWSFPEDGIIMLIQKCSDIIENADRFQYRIIVVEADDQFLSPGSVIGYLSVTPDANQYQMWLYTESRSGILSKPQSCVATLIEDGYGLTFRKKEHRIKINPMGLLPNFWRIVKIQSSDPTVSLKRGFIKIYPSYDGNGSIRNNPRYL